MNAAAVPARIQRVSLLGHAGDLAWRQSDAGIEVTLPARAPGPHACALKIEFFP